MKTFEDKNACTTCSGNVEKEEENKTIFSNIETYGCHILQILEEDDQPRFSYSIGIQKRFDRPELIVTGLKFELAHFIINDYCNRVQAGELFEKGKFYGGFIEGFDVTFKTVKKEHYNNHFGYGQWLYKGNNFDVLQMVWPSVHGKFPWDDDAPEDYLWYMPQLY